MEPGKHGAMRKGERPRQRWMLVTWLLICVSAASGCAHTNRVARTWPVPECPPEGVKIQVVDLTPQGIPFYGISRSSWRDLSTHLQSWQECAKARGEVIEEVNHYMKTGESAGD